MLKPFKQEQLRLEASANPTLSMAISAYNRLMSAQEVEEGMPFAKAAARAKEKLYLHYEMASEHYTVAAARDPRFQLWYCKKDTSPIAVAVAQMEATVRTLLPPYLENSAGNGGYIMAEDVQDDPFVGILVGQQIDDELLVSFPEYAVTVHPTKSPFEWWSSEGKHFPSLAKAAKDYLRIPASLAPLERAFSKAWQTQFRHKLHPVMISSIELL